MWLFLLSLCVLVPSLALYFFTAFVLIRYWKSMRSSFFIWYLFDLAMNLLTTVFTFFTLKISAITCRACLLAPVYNAIQGTFVSNFLYAMMYHMSYVQYSTTAIISLNRLSVILIHYSSEKWWYRRSWILMLLVYFLPFAGTAPIFWSQCEWSTREDDTFVLGCVGTGAFYFPLILFQLACIAIAILSNVTSLVAISKASSEMRAKSERNFILLISVTTSVQLLGTVISCVLRLNSSNRDMYTFFHTYILPFISDAITFMHPYLLCALSNQVRTSVKRHFWPWGESSSVEVIHLHGSQTLRPTHPQQQQPHLQPHNSNNTSSKF